MTDRNWKGNTFGNRLMHEKLIAALRVVDVRVFYAFTAVFVIPVCLITNRRSSAITYRFLRQRIGFSPLKAAWKTCDNFFLFAQVVIDRFAMFAGRRFKTTVEGYEHYEALAEKGYVQLSAHIGNYEVAGYTLVAEHQRFNALVYGGEKATVMAGRTKLFGRTNIRMLPVMDDGSHVFALNEALANHEIVSMPADRTLGSNKTIELDFLGAKADFPLGPFTVATMRGEDVLAVNVMKTSLTSYTIFVEPLTYDKSAPRREQTRQLATAYTACLERTLRSFPTQWYNYFEFWK